MITLALNLGEYYNEPNYFVHNSIKLHCANAV